jgi:hypothetical protein
MAICVGLEAFWLCNPPLPRPDSEAVAKGKKMCRSGGSELDVRSMSNVCRKK